MKPKPYLSSQMLSNFTSRLLEMLIPLCPVPVQLELVQLAQLARLVQLVLLAQLVQHVGPQPPVLHVAPAVLLELLALPAQLVLELPALHAQHEPPVRPALHALLVLPGLLGLLAHGRLELLELPEALQLDRDAEFTGSKLLFGSLHVASLVRRSYIPSADGLEIEIAMRQTPWINRFKLHHLLSYHPFVVLNI